MSETVFAKHSPGVLDEVWDAEMARRAADILGREYPGHPWVVGYQGQALHVRHSEIDAYIAPLMRQYAKGLCYTVKHQDTDDPKVFRQMVLEAGGKMLEAFNIPRTKWIGVEPTFPWGLFTQKVGVLNNGS